MKISSIPKSGRKGSVDYLNTRYGKAARQYVPPRNPQTTEQQGHRHNVRAVSGRWRTLAPEQHAAWRMAAANNDFVAETGRRVRPTGYNFFVSLNIRRADLDLPQFDIPPAKPVFTRNPVVELDIANTGGKITLKLRVPSPPAQYTLVQGSNSHYGRGQRPPGEGTRPTPPQNGLLVGRVPSPGEPMG